MKRDMELIRKILLAIEQHPRGFAHDVKIDGIDEETIGYHNFLIVDAGLADGCDVSTMGSKSPEWAINHLTSAGHDFLDASREPARWEKAKKLLGDATVGAYVGLLNKLAVHYAMKAAGLDD